MAIVCESKQTGIQHDGWMLTGRPYQYRQYSSTRVYILVSHPAAVITTGTCAASFACTLHSTLTSITAAVSRPRAPSSGSTRCCSNRATASFASSPGCRTARAMLALSSYVHTCYSLLTTHYYYYRWLLSLNCCTTRLESRDRLREIVRYCTSLVARGSV